MKTFDKDSLEWHLNKLSEECSEVIKEVSKIFRFGLNSRHEKYDNIPHIVRLLDEIFDVEHAIKHLKNHKEFRGDLST